ncbi:MAG: UDP-4-amino-4,6-dideoxy-N-acetyl-beta-L-altrosamine transaminase [Candidatus Kapaibacterium sp.]
MIPYGRQEIRDEDIEAVISVLKSDFITTGPQIELFESEFAGYCGSAYAVAVSSGTAALHLAYLCAGLKKGSKALTSAITFAATSNAALYCGADMLFSDIDPDSYIFDIDEISEELENNNVDLIAPVHMAGYPVNTEKLHQLSQKAGFKIVEDACHAPGSYYIDSKGEKVKAGSCTYSDMTVFSFHPVKHITSGEGGMITTNDKAAYERLKRLRSHGVRKSIHGRPAWYYEMTEQGFNYRMTDFQAALGRKQLSRLDSNIIRRRQLADNYYRELSELPLKLPKIREGFFHSYHLYIIQADERDSLYNFLAEKDIHCQVHYMPVYRHPYYEEQFGRKNYCPVAEKYFARCISLPIYHAMKDEEQETVINAIKDFFKKQKTK